MPLRLRRQQQADGANGMQNLSSRDRFRPCSRDSPDGRLFLRLHAGLRDTSDRDTVGNAKAMDWLTACNNPMLRFQMPALEIYEMPGSVPRGRPSTVGATFKHLGLL